MSKGGKFFPNFKVFIESSSMKEPVVLDLKDCRIRVLPAGPGRRKNDLAMQIRGIVRPNAWLEVRSGICDYDTGMELTNQTVLQTDPVQQYLPDSEYRRNHVINDGKAGGGRKRGLSRPSPVLSKKASIEPLAYDPNAGE